MADSSTRQSRSVVPSGLRRPAAASTRCVPPQARPGRPDGLPAWQLAVACLVEGVCAWAAAAAPARTMAASDAPWGRRIE
jgi:hypothetical protein